MKKILSTLMVVVIIVMTLGCTASAAGVDAVMNARKGVVRIYGVDRVLNEEGKLEMKAWFGTGFGVGEAGKPTAIFATNKHVTEGADELYILLDDEWKTDWIGDVNGQLDTKMEHAVKCEVIYEPETYPDYAIIRAERAITERIALPLMYSDLAQSGERVYTLGYPGLSDSPTGERRASLDAMTTSQGVVSHHTVFSAKDSSEAIQTDANINSGNSGGPLITEEGYVIGLNTWGFDSKTELNARINLSLEIDYVIERLNNLIDNGTLANFSFTVIESRDEAQTPWVAIVLIAVAVLAVIALVVVLVVRPGKKKAKGVQAQPMQQPMQQPVNDFPKTMPAQTGTSPTLPAYDLAHYCLVGENGQYAGKRFDLDRALRMGRNPGVNDICFMDNTAGVSGVHCVLAPASDGVVLTDLGSSYGTLLADGRKLAKDESVTLHEGDVFGLGSNNQLFRIERKGM